MMMEIEKEPTGNDNAGEEDLKQLKNERVPEQGQEVNALTVDLTPTQTEITHKEQLSESKELAKLLELLTSDDKAETVLMLTDYFKIKKLENLFTFEEDPQKLSQEIWSIEEKIRTIKVPEDMPDATKSIRESLLSTVLSGKVSAEVILDRLNGEITVSKQAGEEVGDYENSDNLAAFFRVEGGVSSIYLYEKSMDNDNDPNHHFQHELGHIFAETGAIWDQEVFLSFLQAVAEMDDAKIAQIAEQASELSAIYNLIKNPDQAIFFRPYIKEKLSQLGSLEEGKLPQARITAAKEIIAEMTAFYLESADDELSYFNARLKYIGGDVVGLLKNTVGPADFDSFKEQNDLDGRKPTAKEVFEFIKGRPEFQADFQAQQSIIEKMESAFKDRGGNIKPISETMSAGETVSYADGDFGDTDQLLIKPGASGSISGGDHDSPAIGGQATPDSPLAMVWSAATGQKETFKTPLSQ